MLSAEYGYGMSERGVGMSNWADLHGLGLGLYLFTSMLLLASSITLLRTYS